MERKIALARDVHLGPLRKLAVQHDGRVKILDTLARETVMRICGRREYQDLAPEAGGRARKVSYDPLFTTLDLMIDPAYYLDKPLFHVEYLPLRRAFVEEAFKDERAREQWMHLMRISPMVVMQYGEKIQN